MLAPFPLKANKAEMTVNPTPQKFKYFEKYEFSYIKHIRVILVGVTESRKFVFIFSKNLLYFLITSRNTNIYLCMYNTKAKETLPKKY